MDWQPLTLRRTHPLFGRISCQLCHRNINHCGARVIADDSVTGRAPIVVPDHRIWYHGALKPGVHAVHVRCAWSKWGRGKNPADVSRRATCPQCGAALAVPRNP